MFVRSSQVWFKVIPYCNDAEESERKVSCSCEMKVWCEQFKRWTVICTDGIEEGAKIDLIGVIGVDTQRNGLKTETKRKTNKRTSIWCKEKKICWSMPTKLIKMPIQMPRNSKFENLMLFIRQTVDTPAAAATATIIAKSIKSSKCWNVYLLLLFPSSSSSFLSSSVKKKITHYHNDHYELIKSKIDHQREIFVESITVHPQFTQTHTCAHACGSWFKMWLVFCAQPNERDETVGSNKNAPYMQRLTEHFV